MSTNSQAFSIDLDALPASKGILSPNSSSIDTTKPSTMAASASAAAPLHPATSPPILSPTPQARTTVHPASPARPTASTYMNAAGLTSTSPAMRSSSPSHTNAGNMLHPSPRRLSPATSQIFERDVQDSSLASADLSFSPAIPSHKVTEDHIPAVLEASSLAITDAHLGPDDVEIVTHAAHQPAAAAVAGIGHNCDAHAHAHAQAPAQASSSFPGTLAPPGAPAAPPASGAHDDAADDDAAPPGPTYGAVDPLDPRRLSFISYADIVHAEQADVIGGGGGGGAGGQGMLSLQRGGRGELAQHGRSASPAKRLQVSGAGDRGAMPPPAGARRGSVSPSRGAGGGGGGTVQGELMVETMRQSMREAVDVHKERSGSVSH